MANRRGRSKGEMRRKARQLPEQLIQVLQEAMVPIENSHVHCALAICLAAHFQKINDYKEAMTICSRVSSTTPARYDMAFPPPAVD